tara:strand:+ start:310 stop:501 length:192 start_codon:yes stop_codon:yes gene_type:complete
MIYWLIEYNNTKALLVYDTSKLIYLGNTKCNIVAIVVRQVILKLNFVAPVVSHQKQVLAKKVL